MTAAGLPGVHDVGAWVLIALNGIAGLWALAAHLRPALRVRLLWAVIIAAQLAAFGQAISGALLVTAEDRKLDDLHALYGFSALIAVGILYSYRTSPFARDKEYLLYGFGCLFIMGLGLRELVL
ncbi:hypothetical protein BH20ACT4_BH20ACT4_05330 [soil metagenome]